MRNLITIINLGIIILITTILTQSDKISTNDNSQEKENIVRPTELKAAVKSDFNRKKISKEKPAVDEAVISFLNEITEGRLMDLEEGKIAKQRSTKRSLKEYGSLMEDDQTEMLKELKRIAQRKNVSLPVSLGPEKADGLHDLEALHGKSFDKKFIRMMIIDHKRDVKILKNATSYGDADIQVFATKYLPVVQSHLDKIRALKKSN
jgi:putative membrane protein